MSLFPEIKNLGERAHCQVRWTHSVWDTLSLRWGGDVRQNVAYIGGLGEGPEQKDTSGNGEGVDGNCFLWIGEICQC